MTHYDVFNGDADGLCSLLQLRLAHPRPSVLVTGAKRDIQLLDRVPARSGDSLTVLDISLAVNNVALVRLLDRGASVEYFDHHYAGEVPFHPRLAAHIDPSPGVCTGMLVDRHLAGRHRIWAVVAAFGDNLVDEACDLASSLQLTTGALAALKDLGDGLTYNTYGDRVDDAIVRPDELFRLLLRDGDPLRFVAADAAYAAIDDARRRDLDLARRTPPTRTLPGAVVYMLPDAPWTRRVRGLFGNEVANGQPTLAHAMLTVSPAGDYAVSVRAPRARPTGADALCRQFPTGGGRAAAAGIDHLPCERLDEFIASLARAYPSRDA
jgi:hypothetical protein